jgi:hypothetical protein
MVVVAGEFTLSRSPQGGLTLVEKFSDNPRHVVFRVIAPSTTEPSQFALIGKTHFRVFRTVLHPLGDDGVIFVPSPCFEIDGKW